MAFNFRHQCRCNSLPPVICRHSQIVDEYLAALLLIFLQFIGCEAADHCFFSKRHERNEMLRAEQALQIVFAGSALVYVSASPKESANITIMAFINATSWRWSSRMLKNLGDDMAALPLRIQRNSAAA